MIFNSTIRLTLQVENVLRSLLVNVRWKAV